MIEWREWARSEFGRSARLVALIDPLLANPYMTVARASKILGVSDPTCRADLAELEAAGVLTLVPTPGRRRLYVSRPIMEIIGGNDGA